MDDKIRYHLTGLLEALGVPEDAYLSVGIIPDTRSDWTFAEFYALVEELGSSVRPHYPYDERTDTLEYYQVQHLAYDRDRDGLRANLSIHSPKRVVKGGTEAA
jgi:hypothetical protein